MNYYSHSRRKLLAILRLRDDEIADIKKSTSWRIFKQLTLELDAERRLRQSYQDSTEKLQEELTKYRILVGDEKSTEEVAED